MRTKRILYTFISLPTATLFLFVFNNINIQAQELLPTPLNKIDGNARKITTVSIYMASDGKTVMGNDSTIYTYDSNGRL